MAKLYFRYGAMGSSKTANALMAKFNYNERGQQALLLKPAMECRDGTGVIASRAGISSPCRFVEDFYSFDDDGNIVIHKSVETVDCVIVDEAQFLTPVQVKFLARIVDDLGIPVLCYGLRTDFQGNFFPGSGALMAVADKIEEVKTICWCGRKATHNARFNENGVVRHGEQFLLGGNDQYVGVCRKHFCSGEIQPHNRGGDLSD